MYELVQKSHKKITNWYKRHYMYEFVLVNLYTKISKKKICIRVGISTRDQYLRLIAQLALRARLGLRPRGLLYEFVFYNLYK
jgi:hypothetical protein